MFAFQCLFCEQGNRAGAKFCDNCGSPLNLKACWQCQAINERAAQSCRQCGTAFVARTPIQQAAAGDSVEGRRRKLASEAAGILERRAEAAVRHAPAVRLPAPSFVARPHPTSEPIPSTGGSAGSARAFRTVPSTLVLAAIAGLAYYVCPEPQQASSAPAASAPAAGAPPDSVASTLEAASAPTGGSPLPIPRASFPEEPVTAESASGSTVVPTTPALPVGLAQQAASETEIDHTTALATIHDPPPAVRPDVRANGKRSDGKPSTAIQPTPTKHRSAAAAAREDLWDASGVTARKPALDACTAGVAALGLCNPNADKERNRDD